MPLRFQISVSNNRNKFTSFLKCHHWELESVSVSTGRQFIGLMEERHLHGVSSQGAHSKLSRSLGGATRTAGESLSEIIVLVTVQSQRVSPVPFGSPRKRSWVNLRSNSFPIPVKIALRWGACFFQINRLSCCQWSSWRMVKTRCSLTGSDANYSGFSSGSSSLWEWWIRRRHCEALSSSQIVCDVLGDVAHQKTIP